MFATNRAETFDVLQKLSATRAFSFAGKKRWKFENENGYTFCVSFDFTFSYGHTFLHPSFWVINKKLSDKFDVLRRNAGENGKKLFAGAPKDLFYSFPYRRRGESSDYFHFAKLEAYLALLADRFDAHCLNVLSPIGDGKALLEFLISEKLLRQPMGLVIEMILSSTFLSEKDFAEKYFAAKLPVHQKYYEQILLGY